MIEGLLTFVLIVVAVFAVADLVCSFDFGIIKFIMRKLGLYGDIAHQAQEIRSNNKISAQSDIDNIQNIGASAEVIEPFTLVGNGFEGRVKLNGVSWKALCRTSELALGTIVVVKKMSNLTLDVEKKP